TKRARHRRAAGRRSWARSAGKSAIRPGFGERRNWAREPGRAEQGKEKDERRCTVGIYDGRSSSHLVPEVNAFGEWCASAEVVDEKQPTASATLIFLSATRVLP